MVLTLVLAVLDWLSNLLFAGLVASVIGASIGLAPYVHQQIQERKEEQRKKKRTRRDLRNEMKRMYPQILSHRYHERELTDNSKIFRTDKYDMHVDDLHLLTNTEKRELETLYNGVKVAREDVQEMSDAVVRSDLQYIQVQERDLHNKLLAALNAVEEEMDDTDKTKPEDYDVAQDEWGDAKDILG